MGLVTMTRVDTAYALAAFEWIGLNWRVTETGDALTELTARVEADADAAAALGSAALHALRVGDHDLAIREAEAAARLEREYGDAPAWQPFVDAVRAEVTRHDS